MATRNLRQNLLRLVVFLLPVVLVKGLGSVFGAPGAADVAAATLDSAITDVVNLTPPAPAWAPSQLRAAARIDALRKEPFGTSPLFYEPKAATITPIESHDPGLDFKMRLQAILASPLSVTALINGRLYRVGELVGNTAWRVISIDSEGRKAVVEHESTGTVRTLEVDVRR